MIRHTFPLKAAVAFALALYPIEAGAQTIWHVDDDNACPGTGTQGDPFCSIQAGIDVANDLDVVQVSPGSYNELVDFIGKAITLRSTDPTNPAVVAATIIDGTALNDSVVKCISGEGSATVLDGFTITGGDVTNAGGMLIDDSNPTLTNCVFTNNHATEGGGMFINRSSPILTNCSFVGNTATGVGGGGVRNSFSNPSFTNCTFRGNSATFGGGMESDTFSNPTLTNCTFSGNSANVGGGMYNVGSSPMVTNCTFSGNTAGQGGAMFTQSSSGPTVTNCIVWANIPNQIVGPVATVTYSDVQGGFAGEGNIDADPTFVDPANGDLRLSPGSPCIDAADNMAVPPDAFDLDADGNVTERIPLDLDGNPWNPRFVDDAATADSGNGVGCIVDMGAYEFPGSCTLGSDCTDCGVCTLDVFECSVCTLDHCEGGLCTFTPNIYCDVDNDGDVDLFDLFCILDGFSGNFSTCLFESVDLEPCGGDGVIDVFDLFAGLNCFSEIDPCCGGLP